MTFFKQKQQLSKCHKEHLGTTKWWLEGIRMEHPCGVCRNIKTWLKRGPYYIRQRKAETPYGMCRNVKTCIKKGPYVGWRKVKMLYGRWGNNWRGMASWTSNNLDSAHSKRRETQRKYHLPWKSSGFVITSRSYFGMCSQNIKRRLKIF